MQILIIMSMFIISFTIMMLTNFLSKEIEDEKKDLPLNVVLILLIITLTFLPSTFFNCNYFFNFWYWNCFNSSHNYYSS